MLILRTTSTRVAAVLGVACIGLAAAGCSSSSSSSSSASASTSASSTASASAGASTSASASASPSAGASSPAAATGTVNVAYASSLTYLNEKIVSGPFKTATGDSFSGTANASGEISDDILANEISPDVFESVGGDNITPLEPKYTKWYVQYAGTSMVIAYNPKSKYAPQFKAYADGSKSLKSLFTLLETPGLKLGRTDPNIDPQGRDFIYMLELAQSHYHLPSNTVAKILGTTDFGSANSSQIYAEASLDSTLQSGQLDASSAFITQAKELHLDYVPLPTAINLGSAALAAQYAKASVTIAGNMTKTGGPQVIDITAIGTPTPAAIAFIKYTLSAAGLAQYQAGGFTLLTPTLFGKKSDVPAAIASELGR